MSGLLDETLVPFGELAKAARGRAGRVNTSTVFRWCKTGVRGSDGTRVKLEHVRVGGRLFSSLEAYGRFVNRVNATPEDGAIPTRTPSERRKASERAAAELERMGA